MDPTTEPIAVTLERLKCYAQEDTEPPIIDTEDDEPYALVLAVDGTGRRVTPGRAVTPPAGSLFRVGPVEDVDKGDVKPFPANTLWGLDGLSRPLAEPDRAFFVVALLENDAARPSEVQGQVQSVVVPALAKDWAGALTRLDLSEPERFEHFVRLVRDTFQTAVNVARRTASPPGSLVDPDDLIGPAQILRFSGDERNQVLTQQTTVERTLRFAGDDASYDLAFSLHPPREVRWRPWFPIAQPGSATDRSAISAVVQRPGHLDVFWVAPDGGVGTMWWDQGPGGAWNEHAPFRIAPPGAAHTATGITAVTQRPGHLDVFWIAPDGGVGTMWWDQGPGGAWNEHAPFRIAPPGSAVADSAVSAVVQRPGHLDVFWVAPDGAVMTMWWDQGPGGAWNEHGHFSIAPPGAAHTATGITAVTQRPGHLDVFWVAPDGAIMSMWWDQGPGGAWNEHGHFSIAPPGSAVAGSPVAAVSQRPGHLDVFWIAPDGAIMSMWWDQGPGGAWNEHGHFSIAPPGSAHPDGGITAVTQQPGHLDVFWIAPDGGVGTMWWYANPEGAWSKHTPFLIAPPGSAQPGSGISAVVQRSGHLDVFWIAADKAVATAWWG